MGSASMRDKARQAISEGLSEEEVSSLRQMLLNRQSSTNECDDWDDYAPTLNEPFYVVPDEIAPGRGFHIEDLELVGPACDYQTRHTIEPIDHQDDLWSLLSLDAGLASKQFPS